MMTLNQHQLESSPQQHPHTVHDRDRHAINAADEGSKTEYAVLLLWKLCCMDVCN